MGRPGQFRPGLAPFRKIPLAKAGPVSHPKKPSSLEEVDSQWAEVEGFKRLRCKGSKDEFNHTMFFEADRTKSELLLECLENGTYAHVDEWPVCLQGVLCIQKEKSLDSSTK